MEGSGRAPPGARGRGSGKTARHRNGPGDLWVGGARGVGQNARGRFFPGRAVNEENGAPLSPSFSQTFRVICGSFPTPPGPSPPKKFGEKGGGKLAGGAELLLPSSPCAFGGRGCASAPSGLVGGGPAKKRGGGLGTPPPSARIGRGAPHPKGTPPLFLGGPGGGFWAPVRGVFGESKSHGNPKGM